MLGQQTDMLPLMVLFNRSELLHRSVFPELCHYWIIYTALITHTSQHLCSGLLNFHYQLHSVSHSRVPTLFLVPH